MRTSLARSPDGPAHYVELDSTNRESLNCNPPSWLPSSQHENYAHLLPADGHGRPTWSRRSPSRGGARRSPESPRTLCRRPRTDGSTSQANLLPSAPTRLTYQSISSRRLRKLQSTGRGGTRRFAKKRYWWDCRGNAPLAIRAAKSQSFVRHFPQSAPSSSVSRRAPASDSMSSRQRACSSGSAVRSRLTRTANSKH